MLRKVTPGTSSRLTVVDHGETYGRHVLDRVVRDLDVEACADLGCGGGDDLAVVRRHHPNARCTGVEHSPWNRDTLAGLGIEHAVANIETDPLPFEANSLDLVIANQVLEHTKEIYWIQHEVFRCLKVGGVFFLGVPNVLSLHNRLLGLFGGHPTNCKMISAHVRIFSIRDTKTFYRETAGAFATVEAAHGSQFYPFPGAIARPLATLLPGLAFSIFFVVRKTAAYERQFLDWLDTAELETNFYRGP